MGSRALPGMSLINQGGDPPTTTNNIMKTTAELKQILTDLENSQGEHSYLKLWDDETRHTIRVLAKWMSENPEQIASHCAMTDYVEANKNLFPAAHPTQCPKHVRSVSERLAGNALRAMMYHKMVVTTAGDENPKLDKWGYGFRLTRPEDKHFSLCEMYRTLPEPPSA